MRMHNNYLYLALFEIPLLPYFNFSVGTSIKVQLLSEVTLQLRVTAHNFHCQFCIC